ncbi:hypothetical protein EGW08_015474 [Elysia chlorotica]|uniref:BTB domain-containing protein n=1 Tax=Elysia chlorotica TaxID=188477 RepID=A0A3S0ZG13_ELYCH|nr:hypothetical protein EGW08_015474 [Elysia chlorotica]
MMSSVITLNVGGTLYTTTRSTLLKYPDSMLGSLASHDCPSTQDENGHLFIDRDGAAFKYILNFLRSSQLCLPSDFTDIDLLAAEADFYQVTPLIDAIREYQEQELKSRKKHLYYIEIVEIRTGHSATMPSCNSRVKVFMVGRKDILKTLPNEVFGIDYIEKLKCLEDTDHTEFPLFGQSIRQRAAEALANLGWTLVSSDVSSSSGVHKASDTHVSILIQHTFRDRWSQWLNPDELVIPVRGPQRPSECEERYQARLRNGLPP